MKYVLDSIIMPIIGFVVIIGSMYTTYKKFANNVFYEQPIFHEQHIKPVPYWFDLDTHTIELKKEVSL